MTMEEQHFDPEQRHYQLDIDGMNVICTNCKKVLEERTSHLNDTEMIVGQYRFIRQNLPCAELDTKEEK